MRISFWIFSLEFNSLGRMEVQRVEGVEEVEKIEGF